MAMLVNRSMAREVTSKGAVREVQKVMTSLGGENLFADAELQKISSHLEELVERLRRLQALSDRFRSAALSPHLQVLIKRAGKGYLLGRFRS